MTGGGSDVQRGIEKECHKQQCLHVKKGGGILDPSKRFQRNIPDREQEEVEKLRGGGEQISIAGL